VTGGSLAEILSGAGPEATRAALHAALDDLLDAADADGGRLDGPAFWGFVAFLARGRGVSDDLAMSAAVVIAREGTIPDDPAELWQRWQWALLSALLARVTAFPGEIMPIEFSGAAFRALTINRQAGSNGGEHADLFGLETQRGADWEALGRAARRLLVGAVYYRAAKDGMPRAKARALLLPDIPPETFRGWVKEVARAKRLPVDRVGDDARAAARGEMPAAPYDLDAAAIADLLRTAWRPNG